MNIYCCECKKTIKARLTNGKEIYPHRADLSSIPLWICDKCGNSVGCHHKTADRTKPLGVIANADIKNARRHIHAILDPLWKSGEFNRGQVYSMISKHLGYEYHTAEIRHINEARKVYRFIRDEIKAVK